MPRENSGVRSMRKLFPAFLLFVVVAFALVFSAVLPDRSGALAGLAYLVNPFQSRGRKRKAAKRRSAAQRAATRKMIAANKRAHPHHASNPFHRKKPHKKKSHRHAVHARRNPSSALMRDVAPIGIGAAGALATDVMVGLIPWPDAVETSGFAPWVKTAAKAGIAIGAGWGVGKALGRPVGTKFMVGALVVISYGLARDLLMRVAAVDARQPARDRVSADRFRRSLRARHGRDHAGNAFSVARAGLSLRYLLRRTGRLTGGFRALTNRFFIRARELAPRARRPGQLLSLDGSTF